MVYICCILFPTYGQYGCLEIEVLKVVSCLGSGVDYVNYQYGNNLINGTHAGPFGNESCSNEPPKYEKFYTVFVYKKTTLSFFIVYINPFKIFLFTFT